MNWTPTFVGVESLRYDNPIFITRPPQTLIDLKTALVFNPSFSRNSMAINVGIVTLKDGSPCIVYDEALPHPIKHVEFCRDDFQISLIYRLADESAPPQGVKFDFPLDQQFVALLEKKKTCAVAFVKDAQLAEIKMYNVVFTNA